MFLESENGYLLFTRDDQGELDVTVFDDARAACWLGRHGHALHERLADRDITPQS